MRIKRKHKNRWGWTELTPPRVAIFIEWTALEKNGKIYETSNTHTQDTS